MVNRLSILALVVLLLMSISTPVKAQDVVASDPTTAPLEVASAKIYRIELALKVSFDNHGTTHDMAISPTVAVRDDASGTIECVDEKDRGSTCNITVHPAAMPDGSGVRLQIHLEVRVGV